MSHFSKVKTSLKDLDMIKKSLDDLGINWNKNTTILKGYKSQNHSANLVIKQNNNYDIGFNWNGIEYQLIADLQFWQQPWPVDLFLDKITQRYAYNSIIKTTTEEGFQCIEETSQENGNIRISLQRWT